VEFSGSGSTMANAMCV